jgi:uncharacterized membrane protein HdeD (DUF308 family)
MLIAGLIAIGVGLLVAAGLPDTSLVTIGILLGVSFLSTGIARISLSRRLSALARNR